MLPVLLFFGAVIAAIAVASSTAKAATRPGAPGVEACSTADGAFVEHVLATLRAGNQVDPNFIAKAHAIALRCFPATAIELAKAMNRGLPGMAPIPADRIPVPLPPAQVPQLPPSPFDTPTFPQPGPTLQQAPVTTTAPQRPDKAFDLKAQPDLLGRATAALATPNNPPFPIPTMPTGKDKGKTLWFIETKKGKPVAIPRFPQVMAEFKAFQKIIGVGQDGRIGGDTLKAFTSLASKRGFTNVPKNVPELAANVTKWGLVLASPLRRSGGAASAGYSDHV